MEVVDTRQTALAIRMRRVVYHALMAEFDEKTMIKGLWLWQQMFDSDPNASIHKFCEYFAGELGEERVASDYVKLIYKVRFLSDSELGDDPWPLMEKYESQLNPGKFDVEAMLKGKVSGTDKKERQVEEKNSKQVAEESEIVQMTPWQKVANQLIQEIYAYLEFRDATAVKTLNELVLSIAQRKEVGVRAAYYVRASIREKKRLQFDSSFTEDEVGHIIHEIYIWFCDYLGPMDADKVFEQVVRLVENKPEALNYSPRNFF